MRTRILAMYTLIIIFYLERKLVHTIISIRNNLKETPSWNKEELDKPPNLTFPKFWLYKLLWHRVTAAGAKFFIINLKRWWYDSELHLRNSKYFKCFYFWISNKIFSFSSECKLWIMVSDLLPHERWILHIWNKFILIICILMKD